MEPDHSARQLTLTNLLPFMNEPFLKSYFKQFDFKDLDAKRENKLGSATFTFGDSKSKNNFVTTFKGKNYGIVNYPITFEEGCNTSLVSSIQGLNILENEEEIIFPINYHKLIQTSYERSMNEPGLIYTDKTVLENQGKVLTYIIKKIGSNLIKGESIMNISLPVNIFDKRSLLQVLAYEASFAPFFLTRSLFCSDKMEKLKWSTVYLVSQLHFSPLQAKPFSPILGETFQCKIGSLNVYVEQVSHKPVTSNFYMLYGENESSWMFKIYGSITTHASTGANSVKAKKTGKYFIEYRDGTLHELYFPRIYMRGLTMGKRIFNFIKYGLVIDRENNLASHLHFHPDEKGAIASFFSSKQKSYPDTINDLKVDKKGKVTKPKDCKSLCSITGEWTGSLSFDSSQYWSIDDHEPVALNKMKFTLPSDSTLRPDLNYFIRDDLTNAQNTKESLEDLQRKDRKLRENYPKTLKK